MKFFSQSRKETGDQGEEEVAKYLKREGFSILGRNIARKTGEIDVLAQKGGVLHFVEVKTLQCGHFPEEGSGEDVYGPADNLHPYKIKKVARTAQWYVAEKGWEGDWQVDGALVWIRRGDGGVRVEYLPQIL